MVLRGVGVGGMQRRLGYAGGGRFAKASSEGAAANRFTDFRAVAGPLKRGKDVNVLRRILMLVGGVLVFGLVVIQLAPMGRDHENPPVTGEPAWDSPLTRELAARACFDYHSNETKWPWYTNVAPISWMTQNNVDEGRRELNFSEWDHPQEEADESAEEVAEGEMPPWDYELLHPEARFSAVEERALLAGLRATFGEGEGGEGHDDDDDDDDHDDD
jgi:hypothetical protein